MALPHLFGALEKVPVISMAATGYRHISVGRDCRSGEGARAHGGRWNLPGSFPTLYLALTQYTARQEFARLAARQKLKLEDLLPRTLCVIDVRLSRVVDLSTAGNLAMVGLTQENVMGNEAVQCQEVGDTAHKMGFEGLLVPSATGSGENLVVYPLNVLMDSSINEQSTITWASLSDLPTQ